MGQGAIEYRGQLMMNCRESYLSNIGEALESVVSNCTSQSLARLSEYWNKELAEMPNGCSLLRLGEYLDNQEAIDSFVTALYEVQAQIGDDQQNTKHLLEQIILFVTQSYEALEPVYRGKST